MHINVALTLLNATVANMLAKAASHGAHSGYLPLCVKLLVVPVTMAAKEDHPE